MIDGTIREIPLEEAGKFIGNPDKMIVNTPQGQWGKVSETCYNSGWIVVEVDRNQKPLRAFMKPELNAKRL
jgi:hypothetical protein